MQTIFLVGQWLKMVLSRNRPDVESFLKILYIPGTYISIRYKSFNGIFVSFFSDREEIKKDPQQQRYFI